MILRYTGLFNTHRIIEKDLSKEKILEWQISEDIGFGSEGNLLINFDINHNSKPPTKSSIFPPIRDIINYEEVLKYLKDNFSNLELK